jgi:hypothetical protein
LRLACLDLSDFGNDIHGTDWLGNPYTVAEFMQDWDDVITALRAQFGPNFCIVINDGFPGWKKSDATVVTFRAALHTIPLRHKYVWVADYADPTAITSEGPHPVYAAQTYAVGDRLAAAFAQALDNNNPGSSPLPITTPDAPVVTATGSLGLVNISITTPGSDGNSVLLGFYGQVSADGVNWEDLPDGTLARPNFSLGWFGPGYFRAAAFNRLGPGPWSTPAAFTTD